MENGTKKQEELPYPPYAIEAMLLWRFSFGLRKNLNR